MDVAHEVAELLLSRDASQRLCLFCRPDCADTVCAYGILKLLFFHCCHDVEAYTDCASTEILHRNVDIAQQQGGRILFFVNCMTGRREEALKAMQIAKDVEVVVLDSNWGRKRTPRESPTSPYVLGGTEEEVLRRVFEKDRRLKLPCYKYHGTPASLCAYQICMAMTPSFKHPNVLWRAIVGCADLFIRKCIHQEQYEHIHEYFMREVELGEALLCIECVLGACLCVHGRECHETNLNFFQQSSLWEALHMSPHLYETFDDAGFEDFIANTLGFPQHLAEYSYYQFVTGPGKEIWEKLRTAGNMIGVQELVVSGFRRTWNGFVFQSFDHALAVNIALSHLRSKQYDQDKICIHDIFRGGEEVMGKPQEMIPRYVQVLKADCDSKRRKSDQSPLYSSGQCFDSGLGKIHLNRRPSL